MRAKGLWSLALVVLLAGVALGQGPEGYLDSFIVKVKPEKRADFDGIVKKMVDANRRHKGDNWIASDVMYGEGNTIAFTSGRQNYAGIEKGFVAFMAALKEALGPAGAAKLEQDFNNCIVSSRGEVRRRRPDLSSNMPADLAALNKLIGQSRWVRSNVIRVRPGRLADFEEQVKALRSARQSDPTARPILVSQVVAGQTGTFYSTTLADSLGAFDTAPRPLRQVLGEAGFQKFESMLREATLPGQVMISRFVPELSNPPEEIASVAPDFWKPKPAAAPKAKPKAAEPPKTQ